MFKEGDQPSPSAFSASGPGYKANHPSMTKGTNERLTTVKLKQAQHETPAGLALGQCMPGQGIVKAAYAGLKTQSLVVDDEGHRAPGRMRVQQCQQLCRPQRSLPGQGAGEQAQSMVGSFCSSLFCLWRHEEDLQQPQMMELLYGFQARQLQRDISARYVQQDSPQRQHIKQQ